MLIDPFGRHISYLRFSVTDRCDLRCRYCLGETVEFVPKAETLSLEEIDTLSAVFIGLGIRRLRLTGGEPLVRRGIVGLVERLGRHVTTGALDEVTLTTNGTLLAQHAAALWAAGVRRVNVSLDSLSPETYRHITRVGRLETVLAGIFAARNAGLAVKINALALRGLIENEIDHLLIWCGRHGFDLSLIEPMPFGETGGCRASTPLPLADLRRDLERRWTLQPDDFRTGGPSRYVRVRETGGKLGFISPITHGFCGTCDRVRVTVTGRLFPCLGHEESIDLKPVLRGGSTHDLERAIRAAIIAKPSHHIFPTLDHPMRPGLARGMNLTGG